MVSALREKGDPKKTATERIQTVKGQKVTGRLHESPEAVTENHSGEIKFRLKFK